MRDSRNDTSNSSWRSPYSSPTIMTIIAGIDPGKTGALAILWPTGACDVFDVPLAGKPPAWTEWARIWGNALEFAAPDIVVIESVGTMPKQGIVSAFNFGEALGFVHALVLARAPKARIEWPTPALWKRKMGLGSDKNASREEARRLIPVLVSQLVRVKDDGRAEAALLAYYGRKYL